MNGGIDVVVCCREGVDPLPESTSALRREAGDGVRIVHAPSRWAARQGALDSSRADVIVYVDPDVVVGDGWLDALRLAWESSPHSIAAIGGPIRADAPEWAHGRLGLIDLGDGILELDPAERTLFAGNLSFWRRALAGVGGFPAPLDGRDANDWHSEEHEAQRQLAHWGWLARYEPGLAAERRIQAPATLRRSYRYGERTGLAGSRGRGVAAKQAAKSSAGAVAALARGRRADALERAARAAENLGVLASARGVKLPGAAPSDVVAVGPQAVPAPPATAPPVDVVLLYHRFAEGEPDPLGLCVAPKHFESQLRILRDGFDVVRLHEVASRVRAGDPGSARIAITIDDGYVDNLTTGIPMIAEADLPATLFAATGHIETGRRFFWDEMQRLLTGPGSRPPRLEVDGHSWPTKTPEERETARAELHRRVQPRSLDEIEGVLDELRDWAGTAAGEPPDATRPVSVDELKQLAQTPKLEIGAHTRDHVNLRSQTTEELRSQVARSRDDVASWTGTVPAAFSYPFGIPRHDVTAEARDAVASAGFQCAVVNQPIAVESGDDPFAIPRVFAPNIGGNEFVAWLRTLLD